MQARSRPSVAPLSPVHAEGAVRTSPLAAARIVRTKSFGVLSFGKKPTNPASVAERRTATLPSVTSPTNFVRAQQRRMRRPACSASISGGSMSIKTTSGACRTAAPTASLDRVTTPATCRPSSSRMARMASAKNRLPTTTRILVQGSMSTLLSLFIAPPGRQFSEIHVRTMPSPVGISPLTGPDTN